MNSVTSFSLDARRIIVIFFLAVLMNFIGMNQVVRAQVQKDPFATKAEESEMTPQEQEEAAQELLKGVEKLVLSQQRRVAKKVIRLYPKSESAKIAKLLLEEYHRFDRIKEEEIQAEADWLNHVRNYWFRDRNPVHNSCFFTVIEGSRKPAVKLTNKSKSPVLYELKGPSMPWNGPYRLRVGETHEFYYAADIRFFSDQGLVVKSVMPGQTLQLNEKNTLHIKQ